MRWLLLVFFGALGLALLAYGTMQGIEHYPIFRDAVSTRGTVVELFEKKGDGSAGVTYFPVVAFSVGNNAEMRFRSEAGTEGAPAYEVGTEIDVLYDPRDPKHARIGSLSDLWAGPLASACTGLATVLLSVLLFVKIGRFEKALSSLGSKERGSSGS